MAEKGKMPGLVIGIPAPPGKGRGEEDDDMPGGDGDDDADDKGGDGMLLDISQQLISAVHKNDPAMVADALRAAHDHCSSYEHEEPGGDEEPEEPEEPEEK